MHVLLIEDDALIADSVRQALGSVGINVTWRRNGAGIAAALGEERVDALLLDLALPGEDGLTLLEALRRAGHATPVLILTARDSVADRVRGLNAGADDYLVKPFDLDELLARVHALVRRARGRQQLAYLQGEVVIDTDARQITRAGAPVLLSAREWALLELLVSRPGMIVSRARLEELLYGGAVDIDSNVVEVHIHSLRRKLGQDVIVNVRGLGYMVAKSQ